MKIHVKDDVWPEIKAGMKEVGVILHGNIYLVQISIMAMDVEANFNYM